MHRMLILLTVSGVVAASLSACGAGGDGGCKFLDIACHRARANAPTASTLSIFDVRGDRSQTAISFAGPQLEFERLNPTTLVRGAGRIEILPGGRTGAPGDAISLRRAGRDDVELHQSDRVDATGGTFDVFRLSDGPDRSFELTILNMQHGGSGLQYATYGIWDESNFDPADAAARFVRAGAMAFGFPTPLGNMPATGGATYLGRMDGRYSDAVAPNLVVSGDARLDADFAGASIAGRFSNVTVDGSAFRDIAITGQIVSNSNFGTASVGAFTGNLATAPALAGQAGPDMTGSVDGNFFGPAAQEVGGIFELRGGDAVMVGGIVGRR